MTTRHWIQSYEGIPHEIDADKFGSVTEIVDEALRSFAEQTAFRSFGQALTYAELDERSLAFAAYLQQVVGVKRGDRVAVMLPNIFAFPIVFIALARLGAIQVNVNPLYTARELEHQLNDAQVSVMVVFDGATSTLAEIVGNTPVTETITVGLGDGGGKRIPGPAVHAAFTRSATLESAIEAGARVGFKPVEVAASDLLLLQYTGGTTGLSKGAALSHRNLIANIEQFKAFMPDVIRPGGEVVVTAIPLYHIFALMVNFLTYFSIGSENWLVANPRDLDGLIDTLKAARPTVFSGVNTLYAGLAAHPRLGEVDWSRHRLSVGGGSAVIGVTSDRWKRATGTFIREGYGLSETSPVVSLNPQFIDGFTGSTGLPLPSTDIKLLDDEDQEVAIGESGEICVKGPQVMAGYWQKPEANEKAFTADGYFRTGDIGVFDEKGFLKIVDRKKDMVIVSGFNVYPNEVEAVASACPGVAECGCIGVPDDKTGEAVALFVVKAHGSDVTAEMIIAHCRNALAAYKVPKSVRFVEALPKSTVGKILRREIRVAA